MIVGENSLQKNDLVAIESQKWFMVDVVKVGAVNKPFSSFFVIENLSSFYMYTTLVKYRAFFCMQQPLTEKFYFL